MLAFNNYLKRKKKANKPTLISDNVKRSTPLRGHPHGRKKILKCQYTIPKPSMPLKTKKGKFLPPGGKGALNYCGIPPPYKSRQKELFNFSILKNIFIL